MIEIIKTKNKLIEVLTECGQRRMEHWLQNKDISCISASRSKIKNLSKGTWPDDIKRFSDAVDTNEINQDEGLPVSEQENLERNRLLKAKLLAHGYGVTNLDHFCTESCGGKKPQELEEPRFFVVNLNDDKNFHDILLELGEFFNQDAILYKPKGDEACLIGTNNSEFPGYGNSIETEQFHVLARRIMSRADKAAVAFVNNDNILKRTFDKKEIEDKIFKVSGTLLESFYDFIENNECVLETIHNHKGFAKQNIGGTSNKLNKALSEARLTKQKH